MSADSYPWRPAFAAPLSSASAAALRSSFVAPAHLGRAPSLPRAPVARATRHAPRCTSAAPASTAAVAALEEKTLQQVQMERCGVEYPVPSPVPESRMPQLKSRELNSIPEMWEYLVANWGNHAAVIDTHHGETAKMTFRQMKQVIGSMTAGFRNVGIQKGDKVAVFAESSYRWLIADQALLSIGAVSAVRGVSAPVDELTYIYDHSDSIALVVENYAMLGKLAPFLKQKDPKFVRCVMVLWSGDTGNHAEQHSHEGLEGLNVVSFDEVLMKGVTADTEMRIPTASRDDVATLLYTSGTTGKPKGVMLTHGNLLHQINNLSVGSLDFVAGDVFVSILPCWHIFERTALYFVLSKGATVVYSNTKRFKQDLVEFKPHILVAVPRVYEVIYNGVVTKIESAGFAKKAIFGIFSSMSVAFIKAVRVLKGLHLHHSARPNILKKLIFALIVAILFPFYKLADKLVWSKIRDGVGGRVKVMICGGGSLQMYLENFFECAKMNICVGYGLTETSPVITNRFQEHNVRGSCGLPPPHTKVKIVDPDTGEVCANGKSGVVFAKGPQITPGYYKDAEATQKVFDAEGYFNTGDIGCIGPAGDLVISGRAKDIIVLSNGENIEPQPIEDAILGSPMIDQIMLVGQDQRHLGALIVPKLESLESEGLITAEMRKKIEDLRAQSHGKPSDALKDLEKKLTKDAAINSAVHKELISRVRSRRNYTPNDRVVEFSLILTPFTVENGMMTQTLKVKKNVVNEVYAKRIARMYEQPHATN